MHSNYLVIDFFNKQLVDLKNNNIDVIKTVRFPDHYNYSEKELNNLINQAKERNSVLLTTEKDYLRINENFRKKISFLKIAVNIKDRNKFINEIKKVL